MIYTIAQAAAKANLTTHTLRYYDKEGLLPFIERNNSGNRVFKDKDFESLSLINCLKNTGMSIKDIKTYMDWCTEGDASLNNRLDVFIKQKDVILEKINELKNHMNTINHKIQYYETAIEAGTEAIHKGAC
ncbi:MerR family transcriptional regulator [uncultured Acetobacterium sp.]|uniref:MerR family transcriptional regulator n=1 Tax=uncultured Acetobacterium sp. TaxID=217139 RepID=UPI0025F10B54|nr:MerR family transcriptional regulator [uncultured Acetobacterium sp.]